MTRLFQLSMWMHIKIVDNILKKIQTIQTLSKQLESYEECLNIKGTGWNFMRSIGFSSQSQSSSPTSSSQSMEIVKK